MPWFKVDDGFWSHPKTLQLSDGAVALWLRAGSWSMHHLTDGLIPDTALKMLDAKPRFVSELVAVSLWIRSDSVLDSEKSGKKSYQFHDWKTYQPTREQVEAERRAAADRKAKSRRESRRDSRVTDGGVTVGVTPTPTRPDPTRPISKEKNLVHPPAELLTEFADFWAMYPRKQGKADALKAYRVIRKKHGARTILAGAQAYALLNIGEDKSFLKLPGGWLRGERWEDEHIVNATKTTSTAQPKECPKHPGYPVGDWMNPCSRCARDEIEGRKF